MVVGASIDTRFRFTKIRIHESLILISGFQDSVSIYHLDTSQRRFRFISSDSFMRWTCDSIMFSDKFVIASDKKSFVFGLSNDTDAMNKDSLATNFISNIGEPIIKFLKGRPRPNLSSIKNDSNTVYGISIYGTLYEFRRIEYELMSVFQHLSSVLIESGLDVDLSTLSTSPAHGDYGFFNLHLFEIFSTIEIEFNVRVSLFSKFMDKYSVLVICNHCITSLQDFKVVFDLILQDCPLTFHIEYNND